MKLRLRDIIHPYGGIVLKPKKTRKANRLYLGLGLLGAGLSLLVLLLEVTDEKT